MKTPTIFTLSLLSLTPSILAQCTDPVPCQDESLNALNTTACQTYHAFIARGSDSGYPGHLGPLAKLVCGNLTSSADSNTTCGYENIVYPANSSWSGPTTDIWCKSAAIGAQAGQEQLREYADRCPDAKLILLGFSQGGSVALDVLGGGGGVVFNCTQEDNAALDPESSPGSHIVAAAIFGAVHRSAHQPYSVQNGGQNYNGSTPRSAAQLSDLAKYKDVLREYCNVGDPICAPSSPDQAPVNHLNYFEKYNDDAAEFIVAKARGNDSAENGTSGDSGDAGDVQQGSVDGGAGGLKVEGLAWVVGFGVIVLGL
ncbi:alpha/beta-hydrolase [Massarina eburnea CBS 473.64]|uniref:Alpha/beta-hydrolase n=1 Tax=Massarina eburnea CBS 473.64 TaxID=1395130 RepID=A0A6A6RYP6_9PLEO|nr:alpha/beta-hydrolase [Massarina eburnea CBS 473.64]